MILGNSAFIHRKIGEKCFVSAEIAGQYKTQKIHIDINYINEKNQLDLESLQSHDEDYAKSSFEFKDNFYVEREVEKMSKSKYNVVNPDDICEKYGTDTLRMYEMFLGPLEQSKPWSTSGISGVHNFLKKLWKLYFDPKSNLIVDDSEPSKTNLKTLHKCIKKVSEDIESFSFNTAVSAMMITVNELISQNCRSRKILEPLLLVVNPFAPHITEEIWENLGNKKSIVYSKYPDYTEAHIKDNTKIYPVSINGKLKYKIELSTDLSKEDIEKAILSDQNFMQKLEGNHPKRVIIIPGKIINFVV
jgi:leucyl-tRNA synthetase